MGIFWLKINQVLGLCKHEAFAHHFERSEGANLVNNACTVEYKLAKIVANEIVDLSLEEVQKAYIYHLSRMGLMTQEGQWKSDLGKKIMLPDIDGGGLVDKCFESATLLADNPYLHECLLVIETGLKGAGHANSAYPGSYRELLVKMNSLLPCGKTQKNVVVRDCVILMVVLETLTKAVSKHSGLFELMEHAMGHDRPKVLQYLKNIAELGLLDGAKMSAVQQGARAIMRAEESGEVKENFTHWLLFINIWMMQFPDNIDNGKVGNLLSQYMTGKAGGGEGDSKFINGHSGPIEFPHSANTESYDYMYSAWNLALMTQFAAWPFFLPKLFNAEVADIHEKPSSFMYHRVISLYLFMRWYEHGEGNILSSGDKFDWRCESMQKSIGKINLENMEKFMDLNSDQVGPTHSVLNSLAALLRKGGR